MSLRALEARFRQTDGARVLVGVVVDRPAQLARDRREPPVVDWDRRRRSGDHQRDAGFVDQDAVGFVHDCEVVLLVDDVREVERRVIAEEVEAGFLGGDVGDVGGVGVAAAVPIQAGDDGGGAQAEEVVQRRHPRRVASGEIVVRGEDVDPAARERVQDCRRHGGERLALAGGHLGEAALMQRDAGGQLHVERAQAQPPRRSLARRGEHRREQVIVGGLSTRARPQRSGVRQERGVGHRREALHRVLAVDPGDRVEIAADVVLDRRARPVAVAFAQRVADRPLRSGSAHWA